ncbi:hypothetical protein CXG81DRAFT_24637 [Caulochytrium protostelioides]|uniref:S-adenosyl-L-methionine-dependent methyltransferase n=1 Tax=Caulochytrium protostelioides TaxID=1555241 RepID=A0A4P9XBG4_9FUNG|nr:hypothetical protein CXG81DRAFT_24637 [Caulochytrium protostelioides]|eukprot:RKP02757.1 hypothetical protein CXG81DRAFT_24637 [Caulochytrium protostelioides]
MAPESSALPALQLNANASSDRTVYDLLMANRLSCVLTVAVQMRVFDAMQTKGPMTRAALVAHAGVTLRGAHAMLIALYAAQLLVLDPSGASDPQHADARFMPSPTAATYLVESSPAYLGYLVEMDGDDFLTPEKLRHALTSAKPTVYGATDPWAEQGKDPVKAERFTRGMRSISTEPARALAEHVLMKGPDAPTAVLDVAGGSGVHVGALLSAHSDRTATILELQSTLETTTAYLASLPEAVRRRVSYRPGDMFTDSWPTADPNSGRAFDAILLSQILHDWAPRECGLLIKKAFETLPAGGRVLVYEKLVDDDCRGPLMTAMVNLDMLMWTEGQQFTPSLLRDLLQAGGFTDVATHSTTGYWSVTVARKP